MTIIGLGSRSLRERPDQNQIVDQAFRIFLKECQNYGLPEKITVFKHGAAPGADILMAAYAQDVLKLRPIPLSAKWGDWRGLPRDKVKLKWRNDGTCYNTLAGFNRNQEMVDSGFDAALCIRMPGESNGSDDMIKRVEQAKKPLMVFHVDGIHEWIFYWPFQNNLRR